MLQSRSDVLKRQVATDGLTGIHNRRHFDEHYAQTLQRMGPTGGSLSLFMVDVDFFKQYNDHYGHGPGDQVLIAALQAGCSAWATCWRVMEVKNSSSLRA
jgi:diguanylate cyclase (GGDEF)-like protein